MSNILFFFTDVQTVHSLPHNIAFYIYGAFMKLSTRFTLDTVRKKFSLQIFTIVWKDFWKKYVLFFILARKSQIFSNFYFFNNKSQSKNSKFFYFFFSSQFKDFQGEKRASRYYSRLLENCLNDWKEIDNILSILEIGEIWNNNPYYPAITSTGDLALL